MSRITQPGKFEGESLATVFLYGASLDGCDDGVFSDDNGGESYTFIRSDSLDPMNWSDDEGRKLDVDDIGLLSGKWGFCLYESNSGFVSFEAYDTEDEYNAAMANIDDAYSEDDEDDEPSEDDEPTTYDVIVANVGTVYSGTDEDEANRVFDSYLEYVGFGRAGTSDITMIGGSDIVRERIGTDPLEHTDDPSDG